MKLATFLITIAFVVQGDVQPTNSGPDPYQTIKNWGKLPPGRMWGSTSAVEIDKDGKSIWVAERCGQNSCLDRNTGQLSPFPPILKFDPSGNLVKSFGQFLNSSQMPEPLGVELWSYAPMTERGSMAIGRSHFQSRAVNTIVSKRCGGWTTFHRRDAARWSASYGATTKAGPFAMTSPEQKALLQVSHR